MYDDIATHTEKISICAVWNTVAHSTQYMAILHKASYKEISTMDYNKFMENFLSFSL